MFRENKFLPTHPASVLELDEWEAKRQAERDEKTELDKRPNEAGRTTRAKALARFGSKIFDKTLPSSKIDGKKRRLVLDSDEDEQYIQSEQVAKKREPEIKRMKVIEERFSFRKS